MTTNIQKLLSETRSQIDPKDLPDTLTESDRLKHPPPWTPSHRGNGHFDVFAANGAYVAHVFVWDATDGEVLRAKLDHINGGES